MSARPIRLVIAIAALALSATARPAPASGDADWRALDHESSSRRGRRDAEWLRQAGSRPAAIPLTLTHAGSTELAEQLESWLRSGRGRADRPAPPTTATATPRR